MSATVLFLIVLALSVVGFLLGRARALASVKGDRRKLHSLPHYYGFFVALSAVIPALMVFVVWLVVQPFVINAQIAIMIPPQKAADEATLGLVMSDVRRIARGLDIAVAEGAIPAEQAASLVREGNEDTVRALLGEVGVALGGDVDKDTLRAGLAFRQMAATGRLWRAIAVLGAALGGMIWAWRKVDGNFRARNQVETVVLWLLVGAASLAILTTLGIILSLIFNTLEFFSLYPAWDFFTGTVWAPSFGGGSQLGILPLLWGTFYISLIALIVAVPIGLFAAVYLSEYASGTIRAYAKPMLELLAGIPTIVYGLFALLTVGPLLMSAFGTEGLGWMKSGTAVITAGLVMGVMLIPFVSSLSDDIINAVPQTLRDGSLGLGATKSETIRQVVIPAALPGIVGAILLATSRAIGETMIVVMGAGAAARLSLNPFEAMTTVTAKIVSQLTGDADFASPEALVAFALGMTLFVITLCLNVVALVIVRRYREQYE